MKDNEYEETDTRPTRVMSLSFLVTMNSASNRHSEAAAEKTTAEAPMFLFLHIKCCIFYTVNRF